MTTRTALLLSACLLALAGCRGAKGSPDSSVKSFFSAVEAEDWEGLYDCISTASKQKLGSQAKAMATFAAQFDGWKNVDLTIDDYTIDSDETSATVRFTCRAAQIEKHKLTEFDCSDNFSLAKEEDGKWHVHLPSGSRLRPM